MRAVYLAALGMLCGVLSACGHGGLVDMSRSAAEDAFRCDGQLTVTAPARTVRGLTAKRSAIINCGPSTWISPLVIVYEFAEARPGSPRELLQQESGRICVAAKAAFYVFPSSRDEATQFCHAMHADAPTPARLGGHGTTP